jgi:hypothetical protein
MKLKEIVKIIDGDICSKGEIPDIDIRGGCGADLMSDVLASIGPHAVLLTGLSNPQVVRTALMADVKAIVFVRGKCPPSETYELASQENIPLITTPLGMFEACGRLYKAGLPGLENSPQSNGDV